MSVLEVWNLPESFVSIANQLRQKARQQATMVEMARQQATVDKALQDCGKAFEHGVELLRLKKEQWRVTNLTARISKREILVTI